MTVRAYAAAFVALAAAYSSIAWPARAQDQAASPSLSAALDRIAAFAPVALQRQGGPGMVVAITDRTHTLRIVPVGYRDLSGKVPVAEDTRFGIGSLTKSMTATALLELRDEGRLDPSKTVTTYLPWFHVHSVYRPITLHDLFTHTSGLPDGGASQGLSGVWNLRYWSTGYAPGTHWSYSNVGYDTLGAVLTTLDNADYPSIVQRRVFDKLGMSDTTAIWSPQTLAGAAQGYIFRADDIPLPEHAELVPTATTHYVDPAGSVLSTGADMARYMRYLLNGGRGPNGALLSSSSFALLSTPGVTDGHPLGSAEPGMFHRYSYGLGVFALSGDKVLVHTGGTLPYTACMMVDLTGGYGVIALTNIGYVAERPCEIVRYAIQTLHAAAAGTAPPSPPPAAPDAAIVDHPQQFAGVFRSPDGTTLTIAGEGSHLFLQSGTLRAQLYTRGGDSFWVDDPRFAQYALQFGRDAHHKVVEVSYGPQWYTNASYAGPRHFSYPREWNSYVGRYATYDADGYYNAVNLFVFKGKLVGDDGTPFVPLGPGLFRLGSDAWSPESIRFDTIINGKAQRARIIGADLWRVPVP
jgi:D-alanyl-D-alanine carboxypeptidase